MLLWNDIAVRLERSCEPLLDYSCTCFQDYCVTKYWQLLPSGVSVASEARPIIAFYSRFRDICMYIYICLSARALHKTMHTLRKSYHDAHGAFGTQAAVRSTTLRSRPFARYDQCRQFCWRQPWRRQRLGPYTYSSRTEEAKLKPDCGTKGRTIGSWTTSAYS